jgi:hypothetical protein
MKESKSKFADILRDRQENPPDTSPPEAPGKVGRPGGKRKRLNPDYVQATAYILRTVHEETKINLIRQGNREFSQLVEELLVAWNQQQSCSQKLPPVAAAGATNGESLTSKSRAGRE